MTPVKTASANPLAMKERMKVPRQHMPEQLAQIRATNFTEVNLGYPAELARQEALRCLECAKPACTDRVSGALKVLNVVETPAEGSVDGARVESFALIAAGT